MLLQDLSYEYKEKKKGLYITADHSIIYVTGIQFLSIENTWLRRDLFVFFAEITTPLRSQSARATHCSTQYGKARLEDQSVTVIWVLQ